MDERVSPLATKVWADSLFKTLKQESKLSALVRKIEGAPPPTRWQRLKGRLRWSRYRLGEYFRNLWLALLGKAEWE